MSIIDWRFCFQMFEVIYNRIKVGPILWTLFPTSLHERCVFCLVWWECIRDGRPLLLVNHSERWLKEFKILCKAKEYLISTHQLAGTVSLNKEPLLSIIPTSLSQSWTRQPSQNKALSQSLLGPCTGKFYKHHIYQYKDPNDWKERKKVHYPIQAVGIFCMRCSLVLLSPKSHIFTFKSSVQRRFGLLRSRSIRNKKELRLTKFVFKKRWERVYVWFPGGGDSSFRVQYQAPSWASCASGVLSEGREECAKHFLPQEILSLYRGHPRHHCNPWTESRLGVSVSYFLC